MGLLVFGKHAVKQFCINVHKRCFSYVSEYIRVGFNNSLVKILVEVNVCMSCILYICSSWQYISITLFPFHFKS